MASSDESPDKRPITELLSAWSHGDEAARDLLVSLVHGELRRLAAHYLRGERPGHTLDTCALVNETYIRLVGQTRISWQNRAQFFGVAGQMMRRLLVDHARRRRRHDQRELRVTLGGVAPGPDQAIDLVALDEALTRLEADDSRSSMVVVLRFFAGLSIDETAAVLEVSPATIKRD